MHRVGEGLFAFCSAAHGKHLGAKPSSEVGCGSASVAAWERLLVVPPTVPLAGPPQEDAGVAVGEGVSGGAARGGNMAVAGEHVALQPAHGTYLSVLEDGCVRCSARAVRAREHFVLKKC
eukprot:g1396.t1